MNRIPRIIFNYPETKEPNLYQHREPKFSQLIRLVFCGRILEHFGDFERAASPPNFAAKLRCVNGDNAMKLHLRNQWLQFMNFYETVYLPDHAAPLNRWVHFLSNVAALLCCGLGLLMMNIYLFAFGLWFQLGPPYLGHILFEKTHRSIDQSPIYAALGSWYTTLEIFLGRQSVTYGPKQKPHDEQQ